MAFEQRAKGWEGAGQRKTRRKSIPEIEKADSRKDSGAESELVLFPL